MGPILAAFLAPLAQSAGQEVARAAFPGQQGSGGGGAIDMSSIMDSIFGLRRRSKRPVVYQYPVQSPTSPRQALYNDRTGTPDYTDPAWFENILGG